MDRFILTSLVSPDFDEYTSGRIEAHKVRCALCQTAPCSCPVFGTEEYFALFNEQHGKR